jgi:hypothetical protein
MDRPRKWMFVFAGVPLLVLGLGGVANWDVPGLWLVPLAFFGLAGIIESRRTSPVLLCVLAGLIAVVVFRCGFLDDDRPFRAAVERVGREGLVVLTHDRDHLYLLEQRYDLEAIDVSSAYGLDAQAHTAFFATVEARIRDLQARGRSVLFDPESVEASTSLRWNPDFEAIAALVERTGIQPLR